MKSLFDNFEKHYLAPDFELNLLFVRLFVCFFFLWKLLSRNFDFYAYVPEDVTLFPSEVYAASTYKLWTGGRLLTDLLTLHWIHWILPRPTGLFLNVLQALVMSLVLVWGVLGDIYKKYLPGLIYATLIYLWGYIFRSGQEVDSIAIYFGILLCLIFRSGKNRSLFAFKQIAGEQPSQEAGSTRSNVFLVFCAYYFASGLRKISDLFPSEWFDFDLIQQIELNMALATYNSHRVPEIFEYLLFLTPIETLIPPIVYLSHLLIPLVFFKRYLVLHFFVFYAVFHFMTFGVSISFTGYILVWGCLFSIHDIFRKPAREVASRP